MYTPHLSIVHWRWPKMSFVFLIQVVGTPKIGGFRISIADVSQGKMAGFVSRYFGNLPIDTPKDVL